MNVTQTTTRGRHLCVGCGICVLACPTRALTIHYTRFREHVPQVDMNRCHDCGTCVTYCPVADGTLRTEANAAWVAAEPLAFGLEGAACFVGHDRDQGARRESASGGVMTRLALGLLEDGEVDAVVHAERLSAAVGAPHYGACVSRTADDVRARRSSVYGPVSYADALGPFRHGSQRLAITGVPCVIRGLRRLFGEHAHFRRHAVTLLGLACSHNVNGQFTDFLAESLGCGGLRAFEARLRDKTGISDANHFNTCFMSGDRVLARQNRFTTLFTSLWRGHAFALEACHYCPDFWGRHADASVKDAWGRWAADPLGLSIVVARSAGLRSRLERDPGLALTALSEDACARSQEATARFKHLEVRDRLDRSPWCRDNRRSGAFANQVVGRVSRLVYRWAGFRVTRVVVMALLGRWPSGRRPLETDFVPLLRVALTSALPPAPTPLVVFGAGRMAEHVVAAIGERVGFLVDNDRAKHGGTWAGRPVRGPDTLASLPAGSVVLIASMYSGEIASQIAQAGLADRLHVIDGLPIHAAAVQRQARNVRRRERLARLGRRRPRCRTGRRSGKILVLGGYGYRNAGDEAQLSANLAELRRRWPGRLVEVLSPDPAYTHAEHAGCAVGEAPRLAFYDADSSSLYGLTGPMTKLRFLRRSAWLYFNAWLVRQGWPTMGLQARRAALLHELSTAELAFFSGGGYLTGSTLSRLWDGAFFMAFARVLGVPVVLSGQTIGVWDSPFSRWLARWGLRHAAVVGTRDHDRTLAALAEIGVRRERVWPGHDDALFCEVERDAGKLALVRQGLGLAEGERFVALNVHFWGLSNEADRTALLEKLGRAVEWIRTFTALRVCCVPMVPSDRTAMDRLTVERPDLALATLDYEYDFRVSRAVFAQAEVCVTMKHHPIVFALGEAVPVVSLARSDYYQHKNVGALRLFGLERFNVDLEEGAWFERFEVALAEALAQRAEIVAGTRRRLESLRWRRQRFWDRVEQECAGR